MVNIKHYVFWTVQFYIKELRLSTIAKSILLKYNVGGRKRTILLYKSLYIINTTEVFTNG